MPTAGSGGGTERDDPDNPIPGEGDPVATGVKGGGEWPDPDTPPSEHAPGSDPTMAKEIAERRAKHGDSQSR